MLLAWEARCSIHFAMEKTSMRAVVQQQVASSGNTAARTFDEPSKDESAVKSSHSQVTCMHTRQKGCCVLPAQRGWCRPRQTFRRKRCAAAVGTARACDARRSTGRNRGQTSK
eukprot:6172086-Pleurochrysis_carterae.AAC.1